MVRVAFITLGCKVNQFETEVIEGLFKQRNYEVVDFHEPADVYVINTCSVTHLGERKSRQLIRRAAKTNPDALIVVTGCYAQISPDAVAAIDGVDVIVGTKDRHRIVDIVEEARRSHRKITAVGDIMSAREFEDIPLFAVPARTRAFLKIQEGCNKFCTYCIIPYARGPLRSRPLASVISEAEKLIAAGFKEIVLTGIHLGAYGRDLDQGITLTDVIRSLLSLEGLIRLRLGSLDSIEVSEELIDLMATNKKLCPHLHLPLQAGDDQVLRRMNRPYTTEEYRYLVHSVVARIPDIAISTDVIVGFPGETETMFENSLQFVESMDFAKIHVFPYSRRAGTPAAAFPDQVPENEKRRRAHLMQAVADRSADKFQRRFLGRQLTVLFETESDGIVDGHTANYLRVYSKGSAASVGRIETVCLKNLYKDGLWGEIVN